MLDVIEAVDGPIRLNVCLNSGKSCPRSSWCPAHPVWVEAQRAMLSVLESARIEQLALGSTIAQLRTAPNSPVVDTVTSAEADAPHHCECTHSISTH